MIKYIKLTVLFVLIATVAGCKKTTPKDIAETLNDSIDSVSLHQYQYGIRIDTLDILEHKIGSGDNLSAIFNRIGFSMGFVDTIVQASKDILDPRKLQAGNKYFSLVTQDSLQQVKYIVFQKNNTDYSVVDFTKDTISAYEFNKEITLKTHYIEGVIKSNLWTDIAEKGENPMVALKLSDVYAWQIDFFDIKKDDQFKVIYEVAYIDDSIPLFNSMCNIHSAIFTHQDQEYYAIPFTQDSVSEFFDENGNSLRKAFLKAPMDFFRITSRFSNSRFHPVLKRYRAHHGVDYAAPTGTPVRTIGDGVVVTKAYQANGAGHYLKIKHNAAYTTSYMHLSKYAKGIQVGSHVKQGQEIGYVGSTGLSTGPHLDFRVYKNGQPIDPLKMESPPSLPVKPELMDSFMLVKQEIIENIQTKSLLYQEQNNNIKQ